MYGGQTSTHGSEFTAADDCNIYLISDCMYGGQRHADGSVFTAVNNCDFCMCSKGSVTCSNSSGCDQGTVSRIGISMQSGTVSPFLSFT